MTLTVSSGFAGIREIPRDVELDAEINKDKQQPQESHLPGSAAEARYRGLLVEKNID